MVVMMGWHSLEQKKHAEFDKCWVNHLSRYSSGGCNSIHTTGNKEMSTSHVLVVNDGCRSLTEDEVRI